MIFCEALKSPLRSATGIANTHQPGTHGIHSWGAPTEIAAEQGLVGVPLGCGHGPDELLNRSLEPNRAAGPLQLKLSPSDATVRIGRATLPLAGWEPVSSEAASWSTANNRA